MPLHLQICFHVPVCLRWAKPSYSWCLMKPRMEHLSWCSSKDRSTTRLTSSSGLIFEKIEDIYQKPLKDTTNRYHRFVLAVLNNCNLYWSQIRVLACCFNDLAISVFYKPYILLLRNVIQEGVLIFSITVRLWIWYCFITVSHFISSETGLGMDCCQAC